MRPSIEAMMTLKLARKKSDPTPPEAEVRTATPEATVQTSIDTEQPAIPPLPSELRDDPEYRDADDECQRLEGELAIAAKAVADGNAAKERNRARGLKPGAELVKGVTPPEPVPDMGPLLQTKSRLENAVRLARELREESRHRANQRLSQQAAPHLQAQLIELHATAVALSAALERYRSTVAGLRFDLLSQLPIDPALWAPNGSLQRLIRSVGGRIV